MNQICFLVRVYVQKNKKFDNVINRRNLFYNKKNKHTKFNFKIFNKSIRENEKLSTELPDEYNHVLP